MTDTPEIERIRKALEAWKSDDRRTRYIVFEMKEAFSPDAMTAVLAHIDAQAAEIERLRPPARGVLVPAEKLAEMQAEIERLNAVISDQGDALQRAGSAAGLLAGSNLHTELSPEIDRLRADEKRLDWLADVNNSIGNVQLPSQYVLANLHSLRAAIDAAMKGEEIESMTQFVQQWQASEDADRQDAEKQRLSCWCETCRPVTTSDMRMVLCPTCGNKRCPHATHHKNPCTGSNEPGQPGSSYPAQQETP